MSKKEIRVPNIGDFKDVEIIEILVKKGQEIKKNDPLITIESDKSSVEIPSLDDGIITGLDIKIGDKVSEGDKILEIDVKENQEETEEPKLSKKREIKEKKEESNTTVEQKNVIVKDFSTKTLASPKARKFARELGIDIAKVDGSERQGRVTENDIKLFVATQSNKSDKKEIKKDETIAQEYHHSEFGEVELKDIPRVKRLSSKYLMNSWTNIPHVTNHDEADITELEEFRSSLTDIYTGEKKKITPLAFIVKALTTSLKKFPNFNCSIDEIDKKELFGGSMTITSLGGIGGSFFTPIINYPEVAILGIGKSQKKQIFINGKFITRTMLPLSLSYDHRIIDGAEAARFNNDLKENLGKNFAYKLAV